MSLPPPPSFLAGKWRPLLLAGTLHFSLAAVVFPFYIGRRRGEGGGHFMARKQFSGCGEGKREREEEDLGGCIPFFFPQKGRRGFFLLLLFLPTLFLETVVYERINVYIISISTSFQCPSFQIGEVFLF